MDSPWVHSRVKGLCGFSTSLGSHLLFGVGSVGRLKGSERASKKEGRDSRIWLFCSRGIRKELCHSLAGVVSRNLPSDIEAALGLAALASTLVTSPLIQRDLLLD